MAKKICWSCGTGYEGYSCPICAQKKILKEHVAELERISAEENRQRVEEAQAIQDAFQTAALDMEMAAIEATEQQKRNISEAWQLQAQSKSDRAYELLEAGMYAEAVRLSKEAINQDPSNIAPYMTAAWALHENGHESKAVEYFRKQISLLNTPRYARSPADFYSVLVGLPDDNALLQAFSDSLRNNSSRWHGSPDCLNLLDELIGRNLLSEAQHLTEALISNSDSLMLQAYWLEIAKRTSITTAKLSAFLHPIPFTNRSQLLKDLQSLDSRKGIFSDTTINTLREGICNRYKEWKPEIENQISESAVREAKYAKLGWGGRLGIACFVIFAGVLPTWIESSIGMNLRGVGSEAYMPVLAFGALFVSIGFGLWGGYISRRILEVRFVRDRLESIEQQEKANWRPVCSSAVSVRRPEIPSFIFIEVVLLIVITGGLFFGIFKYVSNHQALANTRREESVLYVEGIDLHQVASCL